MDFKSGIIDKVQEGQLYAVFHHYENDQDEGLSWEQFKTFVYAVGMSFLTKYYEDELMEELFEWDYETN